MDPLTSVLLNALWAGPVLAGGGVVAVLGAREWRSGKHLGVSAARRDVTTAARDVTSRQLHARALRAEVRRLVAEKAAPERLAAVRAEAKEAERAARAASARVREKRAQLGIAQAERRNGIHPVTRLYAQHDELIARWVANDSDVAKKIAYPDLSDGRVPATAAAAEAEAAARRLRNEISATRMNPARFSAYRDAVNDMRRAIEHAERAAMGEKLPVGNPLHDGVNDMLERSQDAIERVAGAASDFAQRLARWLPGHKGNAKD